MILRSAVVLSVLLAIPFTGCVDSAEFCDPAHDLSDTIVESSTATEVTYRVTVNGGSSNAGQPVELVATNQTFHAVRGTNGTLDSEGRLTMRVTVPITWERAEIVTKLTSDEGRGVECGTIIKNPDIDMPTGAPPTSEAPTTEAPTNEPPTSTPPPEPEPCVTFIEKIETGREHFTGESDAIYRVSVAGDVPEGANVRGMVNGAPVEGEVIAGVAELRHRVYSYGDYTLADIEIVTDACTHDHEQDAETSATASVK